MHFELPWRLVIWTQSEAFPIGTCPIKTAKAFGMMVQPSLLARADYDEILLHTVKTHNCPRLDPPFSVQQTDAVCAELMIELDGESSSRYSVHRRRGRWRPARPPLNASVTTWINSKPETVLGSLRGASCRSSVGSRRNLSHVART